MASRLASAGTLAELTEAEKNLVSHRGKALAVFDGKLRDYLQGGGYGTDQ